MAFFGITVNFIIQKLKSKHLLCLSFLWWQVFLREREKIFYTYSGPFVTLYKINEHYSWFLQRCVFLHHCTKWTLQKKGSKFRPLFLTRNILCSKLDRDQRWPVIEWGTSSIFLSKTIKNWKTAFLKPINNSYFKPP